MVDTNDRVGQENPNEMDARTDVHERVAVVWRHVHDRSADAEVRVIVARRMRAAGPASMPGHQVGVFVGKMRTTAVMVMTILKIGCTWMKDA